MTTRAAVCTLLMNGRAGAFRHKAGIAQMQQVIRELNLDIEVVGTRSRDEMVTRLRQAAEKGGRVAVAGGDGTVGLAVQELARTETALGIVAQGTANNFATALRLPQDLPSALRLLVEGEARPVDLGHVEVPGKPARYFTESAGIGLFADALSLYGSKSNKNYLKAAWYLPRLWLTARPRTLRLHIDNQVVTERAVLLEAANSYRMSYALPLAPDAKVTDGLLDLVVLGDLHRRELIPYYRAIRAQLHRGLPKVEMHKARTVQIETRHKIPVHADDKVVGTTGKAPVTVSCVPRALRVLLDRL